MCPLSSGSLFCDRVGFDMELDRRLSPTLGSQVGANWTRLSTPHLERYITGFSSEFPFPTL